jgi:cytochrome c5
MSRDIPRSMATSWPLAAAVLTAIVFGCGRGDTVRGKNVSADSVRKAAGAQVGMSADAAPTPGFTSAQGTRPTQPAPAVAPAAVAARMAPPPTTTLVTRTTAEEQAALRTLPAGPGHELVLASCLTCHAATMITQQHKDTAGWNKTVTQMIAWGAPVAKDQEGPLVAYLVEHYPARAAGEPARQVP